MPVRQAAYPVPLTRPSGVDRLGSFRSAWGGQTLCRGDSTMSFKDLLVVVDHARNCGRRIDLAARIARDFEAHLTGLYVTTVPYLQPAVLAEFPVDVRDMQTRALAEAAARARGLFAERVEGAGFALTTEWRRSAERRV